ncbi:Uma2 family endonuclease [Floridanema evergladense]|uniref:Uma2 family endonuclease n=1 Tax=Floridaenema evergladense BLCC-F167 TaxID=3153639 RepID=A0ABV4WFM2_9CYAN
MVSSSKLTSTGSDRTTELAECGWRYETITQPDGTTSNILVPLTAAEFLHPQEDYRLPNNTFHDKIAGDAKDILTRRYANTPNVGVFRDLIVEWDIPDLGDHCPDTFVAFGVKNRERNRSRFIVAQEGVRPSLIVEVVSPRYRKPDRETKVVEYARAQVQEYVIIDRRTYRGQELEEVLGYRLVGGFYQPITPDEEGRILAETVGIWIGLREGRLVMEDVQTGERLKTSLELEAENQVLEQQSGEMAALLARYRERFGDLPPDGV